MGKSRKTGYIKKERQKADSVTEIRENIPKRKYKDSVFVTLFSDKAALFDLHKTLFPDDSSITEADIEDCRLNRVLSNGIYNDVAYRARGRLIVLAEHQSTRNWNMPYRMLQYITAEYKTIIEDQDPAAVYRTSGIRIPKPEFYVIYTGLEQWDVKELKLTDLFEQTDGELSIELIVKVLGSGSLKKTKGLLGGYFYFTGLVQKYRSEGASLKAAIAKAIEQCLKESILTVFLNQHRKELEDMLMQEFNLEDALRVREEEGREEGREEGVANLIYDNLEEGKDTVIIIGKLMKRYHMSQEEAAKRVIKYKALFEDNQH